MKDYLTVKDAAKYLKVHPSTVRRFISQKKLVATKLAGRFGVFIISRSDFLEFMMTKVMEKK